MTQYPPFPDVSEILAYLSAEPLPLHRRVLASAFALKGEDRKRLRHLLKDLERQGLIEQKGKIIAAVFNSQDGDQGEDSPLRTQPPGQESTKKTLNPTRKSQKSTLLAKTPLKTAPPTDPSLAAPPLGVKEQDDEEQVKIGILAKEGHFYYLSPIDRKERQSLPLDSKSVKEADIALGDLIEAIPLSSNSRRYKVLKRLCSSETLYTQLSQIALQRYQLPQHFSSQALQQAQAAKTPDQEQGNGQDPEPTTAGKQHKNAPSLQNQHREDIRDIPLVTIDDIDARDHDDAVYAEPSTDPDNNGGWRILVAIADVSHYVLIGTPLDEEALLRANSVYFPDRVVPMLPERLSNDLCSLVPNKDRFCLAVWLEISKKGTLKSKRFFKGLMRSHAKLTYKGVQAFYEGDTSQIPSAFDPLPLHNLYGAYQALKKARSKRGTLDLDIPEHKILFNEKKEICSIEQRLRLESHQLIEEMMILANVAAAEKILESQAQKNKAQGLFRIHDEPREERVEELRLYLASHKLSLSKGRVHQKAFNQTLTKARERDLHHCVSELILRAQSQAVYAPDNIGHYGLNLSHYAHFTSPIRRYADLIVHRALSHLLDPKESPYPYSFEELEKIATHISAQERLAAKAERETTDRYVASFFASSVHQNFKARVSGVTEFALFLTLEGTGSDGVLPLRNIQGDYFEHKPQRQCVIGRKSKREITLGDLLDVHLEEANLILGSLVFSYKPPFTPNPVKKNRPPSKSKELPFKRSVKKARRPKVKKRVL